MRLLLGLRLPDPRPRRRGGLVPARGAAAGAVLRSRCFVDRVETTRDGSRARGVAYLDAGGRRHRARAGIVVLAPSAIETARLLLLSRRRAPSRAGQPLRPARAQPDVPLLHGGGRLFSEHVHAWRGPSTTFTLDDFIGPVTGADARATGCPISRAGSARSAAARCCSTRRDSGRGGLPRGALTSALRDLALRDHIAGISLVGEDLPQHANRVDLDPEIRDLHGLSAPRITRFGAQFERGRRRSSGRKLAEICRAAPKATTRRGAGRRALRARPGTAARRPPRDRAHHGHRAHGARPARR